MKHEVETAFGPVWLWGELTGRPLLLLITGAFSQADVLDVLPLHLPDMDVLRCHLPGNHCPVLVQPSIGVFAAAYREALARLAGDVEITVVGLSAGALVALGLRLPNIRQFLLVEPPLQTGDLWPLAERFADPPPGGPADFVWGVFGMGRGPTEPRDYTSLLADLATPTLVAYGDVPLMPERTLETLPSLVGEPLRAQLRDHPWVRTILVRGAGHNIPKQNPAALFDVVREALPAGMRMLGGAEAEARRPR